MQPHRIVTVICAFFFGLAAVSAEGAELRVAAFNLESGDADIAVVDDLIAATDGIDVWGFSEVLGDWAGPLEIAAEEGEGADFQGILGTTGGADRLLIVYDEDRFDLLDAMELDHINIGGHVRSPLVAHLQEAATGMEFLFVVNHLYRSRADRRHEQARLLNDWAEAADLPIVAVGDYNFDWSVEGGEQDHDPGYDNLVEDNVFVWIRPEPLIRTHCSAFNSVLDFVFAGGPAREWEARSEILAADPTYCPDTELKSDHRPVMAVFAINGEDPLRTELLQRIEAIQRELDALRESVEEMGR